jgi:phage gp16-like protein
MALSRSQKAIIHVAKAKLSLHDDTYRALLIHLTGKDSSTDLDRQDFNAVMGFFEYLGFRPQDKTGPDYGNRPGMASFRQLELVRTLWAEYTRGGDGLNGWLKSYFKVDSLRFLTAAQAPKVITALKAMKARAA